uniref:Uncharacterized protein n=1 Tax=Phocoena sinus TaxID=42100 RepID=A0A8C9C093_PHOSS
MSTVHRILCKFDTIHLTTDHYPPPNVDRSVKAYTNWDAERDAMNIETAIKTKALPDFPSKFLLLAKEMNIPRSWK